MQIALALAVTLVSACALNVGYLLEHSAVRALPVLSFRRPLASARLLLGSPRWLSGFTIEATGWALYVLALALAPLALVQAAAAGGIGILALMVSRITGVPLTGRERAGITVAVLGLALLGASLAGGHEEGAPAAYASVALWLAGSTLTALLCVRLATPLLGGGPAFGLATGILFAAGDVATKMAVTAGDGGHLSFIALLVVCYALGTAVLQAGFQRGSALMTAGIATLVTNALPIAAGMTIFHEPLPGGWLGAVRVAAFAAVVAGAVTLARRTAAGAKAAHARPPEDATACVQELP